MIFDLSEFTRTKLQKDLNFSFEPKLDSELSQELTFTSPVEVLGKVLIKDARLSLDVDLKTTVKMACTRCLDPFEVPFDLHVDESYSANVSEDDEDTIPLSEGDTVDLTDLLTKDIISSLPIQRLCNEDCRGLCQECGVNLNREACDCDKEQVDPRFAALKDLFKEV